ncbi:MED6-domain-containing protein [Coniophora puteana RWD-64-598 SS2]|uniref:Mediator of RNA polymerase II transcription subunit 6 n=1 Tax=Coniophora puteana (strain RWD-64-598) TaxID=741705 RepID=A0A5M3N4V5_CONPW|nr:MED6-domain-containing protein [Coniophora puteana RWD-64-598 SS2]EIW86452.1 MED6-domain-containing protein [Coniophora puteana RWD-64-598 SS2]
MDVNDLHPPDDYSHRFFIWHEWIQANGPLTSENVFEYFTTSMFYDKQSNNQVLRMQTMHTGQPILNEAEELKRFTGVEFAVTYAQPPSLFIIHKRDRLSPEEVRPLAAYFVVNNRIYQSPDLYTILSNRLLTSLTSLQTSMDILRSKRPEYTPRTGFVWPIIDPALVDDAKKKHDPRPTDSQPASAMVPDTQTSALTAASTTQEPAVPTKKQQNSMLMFNAMRTTAAHPTLSFASRLAGTIGDDTLASERMSTAPDTRASAAPTPGTRGVSPRDASTAPTPQDPSAAKTVSGKRKRKRTSLAPAPS